MVDWTGKEGYERNVRAYFLCCPLCGSDSIVLDLISMTYGGDDRANCKSCGARWHLYIGMTSLAWAELELSAKNGLGKELLGKRLDKEEWKKLAQDARLYVTQPKEEKRNEVQVIREKEVIVKIRCHYCKSLFDERLDRCPNCGAGI